MKTDDFIGMVAHGVKSVLSSKKLSKTIERTEMSNMSTSTTNSTDTVLLGTSTEDHLETCRKVIDSLDLKIASLLLSRQRVSKDARDTKVLLGLPRVDIAREIAIERRYLAILGDTPESRILARHIVAHSKEA